MTTYTWATGVVYGDWSAATDWSPAGGPPDSTTDAALIDAVGTYSVEISSLSVGVSVTVNELTLNDAGARLRVWETGTLSLSGTAPTLMISAGTLEVDGGQGGPYPGRPGRHAGHRVGRHADQ